MSKVGLEGLSWEGKDGGLNEFFKRYITDSKFPAHFTREDYDLMISEYLHFLARKRYQKEDVRNILAEMTKIAIVKMLKSSDDEKSNKHETQAS